MRACDIGQRLNVVQKYALLLAGARDEEPIRGKLWWQKEMFLLEKNVPELVTELDFEPALKGPMSEALEWQVDQLVSVGLIEPERQAFRLTDLGRECLDSIRGDFVEEQISMVSELKGFLNDLSKDELLAFVYFIFPDMTIESQELRNLAPKRKDIALGLYVKQKVGLERASEIAGMNVQDFARLLKKKGISPYSE